MSDVRHLGSGHITSDCWKQRVAREDKGKQASVDAYKKQTGTNTGKYAGYTTGILPYHANDPAYPGLVRSHDRIPVRTEVGDELRKTYGSEHK